MPCAFIQETIAALASSKTVLGLILDSLASWRLKAFIFSVPVDLLACGPPYQHAFVNTFELAGHFPPCQRFGWRLQ